MPAMTVGDFWPCQAGSANRSLHRGGVAMMMGFHGNCWDVVAAAVVADETAGHQKRLR